MFAQKKNSFSSVSQYLKNQLDDFIELLRKYNSIRPAERQRLEKEYEFLRLFFTDFFAGRNSRALEVESKQYKKVVESASKQFPVQTFFTLCMDGRVLPVLVAGACANIADSMRVPGGNLREFVRGEDGQFKLFSRSNFASLLLSACNRNRSSVIAEVFDSHVGCAAVKAEESIRGRNPQDGGLLRDVLHKKEIARASEKFIKNHLREQKKVIGIQISFDPNNGFLYMGLETEKALSYARSHSTDLPSYTPEILEHLSKSGTIISTRHLAEDSVVRPILEKHAFNPDWKSRYVQTAENFWKAVSRIKPKLMPFTRHKVEAIYKDLEKDELLERSFLILVNCFSGFLHNQKVFEYAVHQEELIKVSEAGYDPYRASCFLVSELDIKNLAVNIELAAGLVRSNRQAGRIIDRTKQFSSMQQFVEASIPIVVEEVARDPFTNSSWKEIEAIDWSDLPHNWDQLNSVEFLSYLQTKGNIPLAVAMCIDSLRVKMVCLFDPDLPIAALLVAHHLVALPVIVSKNRYNHCIIPFVKLGFH